MIMSGPMREARPARRGSWRRVLVPASVILIGSCSIFLLLWADGVHESYRANSELVDAIMDVQINLATYHLRLEESLYGEAEEDAQERFASLAQASHLTEVILKGGQAEHHWVQRPLSDPVLRRRMATVQPLLGKLDEIGRARMRQPRASVSDPILERQFEAAFKEILGVMRELEKVLETKEEESESKSRPLFIGILVAWIAIVAVTSAGLSASERRRRRAEAGLQSANEELLARTGELAAHREQLEATVARRTADLTATNAHLQIEVEQRLETEERLRVTGEEIRRLTTNLLDAQEVERKRIALELHDELGQALTVVKLRTRAIERGLREDQGPLRRECLGLLEYLDQIIESVRRIALDLSPAVLEDLGLTAALHWLVGNLPSVPALRVTSSIAEIDRLLPRAHWINAYRAVQEALTNAVKHAGAATLSLTVEHRDNAVVLTVEDDGKGFAPAGDASGAATPRGLGLRTLAERIALIGGSVDIQSLVSRGTRVTFTLPAAGEGVA